VFCCGFFAAPTCRQGSAVVFCCGCCCSTYLPSRKCGGVLLWLLLHYLPAIKEVRWCFVVVSVAAPTCHQGSAVMFRCGFAAALTCLQGSGVVFCCGFCCSTYLPSRKCCGVLLWLLLQHLPAIKEVRWCLLWFLLQHLLAIKEVLWCFVVVAVAAPTCHQRSAVVFCCSFCCSTYLPSWKFCGVLLWFLLQHLSAIKEV
jgi:hypothetical protein